MSGWDFEVYKKQQRLFVGSIPNHDKLTVCYVSVRLCRFGENNKGHLLSDTPVYTKE